MKKFFAILLALAMTFALSATALAEETTGGTITIANPVEGTQYEVYKIFDAVPVPNSAPPTFTYTIQGTSPWFNTVKTYAETTANGMSVKEAPGVPGTYVVTVTEAFDPADFAAALNAALKGEGETQPTITDATPAATLPNAEDPKYVTEALPFGYYFVTTGIGTVCILDTNFPNVVIYDKNETPPFEKEVDDPDPELGQVLNFTITGEVPYTAGYEKYIYKVSDRMAPNPGLNFIINSVKLTIGTGEGAVVITLPLDSGTTYDYITSFTQAGANTTEGGDAETNYNGFNLELDMVKVAAAGFAPETPVVITYQAVVTEDALVTDEVKNTAKLEHSHDPQNPEDTEEIVPTPVTMHVYDIDIKKFDSEKPSTLLDGAKFILYKNVTTTNENNEEVVTPWYYVLNTTTDDDHPVAPWVSWDTDITKAYEVTTVNGVASFEGLEEGDYFVREIKAPTGYNLLDHDVPVHVGPTPGESEGAAPTYVDIPLNVPNATGTELPATGGIGTTIFYIVGALLMVGAAVLLIVRKKMSVME